MLASFFFFFLAMAARIQRYKGRIKVAVMAFHAKWRPDASSEHHIAKNIIPVL